MNMQSFFLNAIFSLFLIIYDPFHIEISKLSHRFLDQFHISNDIYRMDCQCYSPKT